MCVQTLVLEFNTKSLSIETVVDKKVRVPYCTMYMKVIHDQFSLLKFPWK